MSLVFFQEVFLKTDVTSEREAGQGLHFMRFQTLKMLEEPEFVGSPMCLDTWIIDNMY